MFATFNTTPGTPAKYLSWTSFNLVQGLLLAPLCFVNPAILLRAGLYTTGIIGSISYVGATAKEEKFLYIGGPLIAGLSVVALSGLAPLVLPVTAMRTLAISEMISLVSLPECDCIIDPNDYAVRRSRDFPILYPQPRSDHPPACSPGKA